MMIPQTTLGIDVSGARLDAFARPGGSGHGQTRAFPNTAAGVARLIDWALSLEAFVVLEATAPWDQLLVRALEAAGLTFHRANPKRARDFAKACGLLAKTDAVDARMLADYGAALSLAPTPPADPDRLTLQALTARRDQLVEMRKAERTRLKGRPAAAVTDSLQAMVAVLDSQIREVERQIEALVAASETLARDRAILRSAVGIGPVACSVLLACLPELGQVDRRAIAALAGLAPIARDSGQMKGKRFVQGGRKRARDALYMAALSATRSAPWRDVYERMRDAGKPPKLAIVAIARKLLVVLNAAIRDQIPVRLPVTS